MNDLQIKAILTGIFFGIWPLMMSRSGLGGNVSSAAFALGVLLFTSPFAFYEIKVNAPENIVWTMVAGACIFGGLGLLTFNGMLSGATPQTVGSLFVLMIVVQIAIPAAYQTFYDGGLTLSRAAGFAAAILAAFLLV